MIIAFAGRKQSGKTTAAKYVKEQHIKALLALDQSIDEEICEIYNFADPIKKLCMDLFGLTYAQCYGTDEDKNQDLPELQFPDIVGTDPVRLPLTPRSLLQKLGTDIFRKIKYDIWSSALLREIEAKRTNSRLALIADCRFPNEVMAIKDAGGIVIKLDRNIHNSMHESETALSKEIFDSKIFDCVVPNDHMTIEEKNEFIHGFLKKRGILQ